MRPRKTPTKTNKERLYEANLRQCAQIGRSNVRRFLTLLGLGKHYDLRRVVLNPTVSNKKLDQLTGGAGYADWRAEAIEEKRSDPLTVSQIARAVLEYRSDKKYKVAWRFSFTKHRIFADIFAFLAWQSRYLPHKKK